MCLEAHSTHITGVMLILVRIAAGIEGVGSIALITGAKLPVDVGFVNSDTTVIKQIGFLKA